MLNRADAKLRLIGYMALAVPLVSALATSFAFAPADIESGRVLLFPTCLYRAWFGVPCPTCGLTRAFAALSHGEIALGLRYHWLSPALYLLFWLGAIRGAGGMMRAVSLLTRRTS
jgi:hypothetical protein